MNAILMAGIGIVGAYHGVKIGVKEVKRYMIMNDAIKHIINNANSIISDIENSMGIHISNTERKNAISVIKVIAPKLREFKKSRDGSGIDIGYTSYVTKLFDEYGITNPHFSKMAALEIHTRYEKYVQRELSYLEM